MFLLQNHEQRIESCESTTQVDVNGVNAHYAANENSFNSGYNRGNDNYRGRPRGSRGGGGGWNQSNNKSICQVYRKCGHIALKCYHWFDLSYQGQEAVANANSTNTSSTIYTNPQAYMVAPSSSDPNNNSWFLDNGATHYITADNSNLASKNDYNDKEKLVIGNGFKLHISHIGNSKFLSNHSDKSLHLNNILHVPHITKNLVSISKFTTDNSVSIEFTPSCCYVKDLITGATLLKGVHDHGLYHLELSPIHTTKAFLAYSSQPGSCSSCFYNKTASCHSSMACNVSFPNKSHGSCNNSVVQDSPVKSLWHKRLGHPSVYIPNKILHSMSISPSSHQMFYDACKLGKLHQESFLSVAVKTNKPLQLIHLDVWGPLNIFIEGYRFYLLFVDAFSRFCWIYPMKHKSKVPSIFLKFQVFVEKQLSSKF